MRRIDGKFRIEGEKILNPAGVEIPEDEPLFLLRARDIHALKALVAYRQECRMGQCNDYQMRGIDIAIELFCQFRAAHPERLKEPGITRGV